MGNDNSKPLGFYEVGGDGITDINGLCYGNILLMVLFALPSFNLAIYNYIKIMDDDILKLINEDSRILDYIHTYNKHIKYYEYIFIIYYLLYNKSKAKCNICNKYIMLFLYYLNLLKLKYSAELRLDFRSITNIGKSNVKPFDILETEDYNKYHPNAVTKDDNGKFTFNDMTETWRNIICTESNIKILLNTFIEMLKQAILQTHGIKQEYLNKILSLFIINDTTSVNKLTPNLITSVNKLTSTLQPSSILLVNNIYTREHYIYDGTPKLLNDVENFIRFKYKEHKLKNVHLFPKNYYVNNKTYVLVAKLLNAKPYKEHTNAGVIIRPSLDKDVYYKVKVDSIVGSDTRGIKRCDFENLSVKEDQNAEYFDNLAKLAIYHIVE